MTKRYTKTQLLGGALEKVIDHANGDDELAAIVAAMKSYGLHIPPILNDVR